MSDNAQGSKIIFYPTIDLSVPSPEGINFLNENIQQYDISEIEIRGRYIFFLTR